jgi:hypothetical protein
MMISLSFMILMLAVYFAAFRPMHEPLTRFTSMPDAAALLMIHYYLALRITLFSLDDEMRYIFNKEDFITGHYSQIHALT